MIEKRQRPVRGERRQPQRQPRELHRRRIEIDAVQTALGDLPAERGAIRRRDVAGGHIALVDQRLLAASGEIAARRHQKRAAAHRWIEHAQARESGRRVRPSTSGASVRRTRNSVIDRGV